MNKILIWKKKQHKHHITIIGQFSSSNLKKITEKWDQNRWPRIGAGQERPSTRLMPWTRREAHGWCMVRQALVYLPLPLPPPPPPLIPYYLLSHTVYREKEPTFRQTTAGETPSMAMEVRVRRREGFPAAGEEENDEQRKAAVPRVVILGLVGSRFRK